jgi:preprotein translocase subunit SecE
MNRQVKRQMAKSGADRPNAPDKQRKKMNTQTERTTPRTYLREVQGEMKRVAWPPRQEIFNSTVIVIIGVVVMTGLIFLFDYLANNAVTKIFS